MSSENTSNDIADILYGDEDAAAIALLLESLRGSVRLRRWLWGEFACREQPRARLAECLDGKQAVLPDGARLLAWLGGDEAAYADTQRQLKRRYAGRFSIPDFGGLSRPEVDRLIRRYRAGHPNCGAFFLLYAWRKHLGGHGSYNLRLLRAGQAFFASLTGEGGDASAKQLLKAQAYFADWQGPTLQRGDYGFADWWKVSVLMFMRAHPKPRYRTGEFCRHLAGQRITVDPKDIRAFCKRHGIARDSRVGRPRKH